MTIEEFQEIVSKEQIVSRSFRNAAKVITPTRHKFGAPTELAAIAVLFPVAVFILREIGMPWLYEAKRYSEMWRLKFHKWIDQEYVKKGLDPEQARLASEALRKELESVTGDAERKAWERFAERVIKSDSGES